MRRTATATNEHASRLFRTAPKKGIVRPNPRTGIERMRNECEKDPGRFISKQYWVQMLSVHLHPFRYTTPTRLVLQGAHATPERRQSSLSQPDRVALQHTQHP
eukprot:2270373-Prymnesium_polylepis.1